MRSEGFDALPFPIFLIDGKSRVLDLNPDAELLIGHGIKFAKGKTLDTWFLSPGDLSAFLDQAHASQAKRFAQDLTLEFVPGGRIDVSARFSVMENKKGFVLVLIPASIRSEHISETSPVAKMVGMLAHEIRNPLSGIKGAAQLLEMSATTDDLELTTMIAGEVDRLNGLIDDLEIFGESRKAEQQTSVNIHAVLAHCQTLGEAGFASKIDFRHDFDPSLPEILCDVDKITQVILNIMKNAAEAIKGQEGLTEGRIKLTTAFYTDVKIRKPGAAQAARAFLNLTIADNGPGISEALEPVLFQLGTSSKTHGKGFGLALAQKILEDHEGWIEFSSQDGGTQFNIYLPFSETT